MPTLKKYSGIKACEDCIQRCTPSLNSNNPCVQVRNFKDVSGNTYNYIYYAAYGGGTANFIKTSHFLTATNIKASADDYDAEDYNGTSTGACTFTTNSATGGVSYQIQFAASETATIKCFKFYKGINCSTSASSSSEHSLLMFAIYFDTPISVTAGDILNMSLNFAYDDQQVAII